MSGKTQQIRDLTLAVVAVLALAIFGYRELYPKATNAGSPDRIEGAASAYLAMQPTSLENVANGLEGGIIKPEAIGQALKDAHTPAANELANALKDAGNTPAALRRAATAIRKGMR